jgi:uncharacterized protein (DUF433 family)
VSDDLLTRIVTNPAILVGKPTVRGLRISVDHVLQALAGGVSEVEFLHEHPELEPEDIRACLLYAARLVQDERVYPVTVP